MPSTQAKHWCFTLNNYSDNEVATVRSAAESEGTVYLVFGREVGECGTPHLQGFVSLSNRTSFGVVKAMLGGRVHLECARAKPVVAAAYCKKDGDYEEFGSLSTTSSKGQRTDLQTLADSIRAGKTFREIAEEDPASAIRYGTGILRLQQLTRPQRRFPPQILTLWGPTGTGKTRRVWEFANHDQLWVHPGGSWFDGYDHHRSVLFDDFDGSWFKITYLLKLLDRYVMPVPVKGSHAWWVPTHIYITSNINPEDWYENAKPEHKAALLRRLRGFGHIEHCQ